MSRKFQHRKDRNHTEIERGLEAAGWGFLDLSQSGLSIDGIAVKENRFVVLEIKDGRLPPSARKLSPKEEKRHQWFKSHGVHVHTVTCVADLASLDRDARNRFED